MRMRFKKTDERKGGGSFKGKIEARTGLIRFGLPDQHGPPTPPDSWGTDPLIHFLAKTEKVNIGRAVDE